VLGLWPRGGLCLIILFLILVTPIAHAFWARGDRNQRAADLNDFMKNTALLGASVMMLVIPEPWPYSVDGRYRCAESSSRANKRERLDAAAGD
jgi:uncharacterized membrane protein YphA (DoxX/SURF4 family)